MTKRPGFRGAAIAATLFALSATAAAQGYPPPPGGGPGAPPPAAQPAGNPMQDGRGFWQRHGIYGGVGLGFGVMSASCDGCNDSYSGLGFNFDIGWHLNPQLGIFLDGYGLGVDPDSNGDILLVQALATFGVQYWVSPPVWLKAGLGSAQQSIHSDVVEDETDTVPGLLLAAGYEVLSSPSFSIDLEGRIGSGFYEDNQGGVVTNIGLQIAVHWHSLFHPVIYVQ